MIPKDRFLAAARLEEPDRVPMFTLEFHYPEKVTGRPKLSRVEAERLIAKGKRIEVIKYDLENRIEVCRKMKFDAMQVNIGVLKYFPTLKQWPEIEWTDEDLDPIRMAIKMAPDLALIANCPRVYPYGKLLPEHSLMDAVRRYYTEQDKLKREMEERTRMLIELVNVLSDLGIEIFRIGADDMASKNGPMMSLKIYEDLIFPNLKRLADAIHRRGGLHLIHSDGNLKLILDGLINTGIDILHSIDPSAGMDIGEVKEMYGDRIALCGNVDAANTLLRGTPEEVAEETKEVIRKASPGGGHILCSSNCIYREIPFENALALFRTGLKYGKYPIKI